MTIAERLRSQTTTSRRPIFGDKLTEVNGLLSNPEVAAVRSLLYMYILLPNNLVSRWDGLHRKMGLPQNIGLHKDVQTLLKLRQVS